MGWGRKPKLNPDSGNAEKDKQYYSWVENSDKAKQKSNPCFLLIAYVFFFNTYIESSQKQKNNGKSSNCKK